MCQTRIPYRLLETKEYLSFVNIAFSVFLRSGTWRNVCPGAGSVSITEASGEGDVLRKGTGAPVLRAFSMHQTSRSLLLNS